MVKKRSVLLAAFFSLIVPGLGQLYNTQLKLAVFYFMIGCIGTAIVLHFRMLATIEGLFLFCFLFLVMIAGVIHAGISAYRLSPVTLQSYNKKYIYILILVVGVLTSYFSSEDIYENPVHFNVPSLSMTPTLEIGETFIINRDVADYDYGDIIVFKLPSDPSIDYVKRLVGKPGDKIQYKDGVLYINEKAVPRHSLGKTRQGGMVGLKTVSEMYQQILPNGAKFEILEFADIYPLDNTPAYTVPEGHVFVLGDNRDNSMDSRVMNMVGFVPIKNIRGKAQFIWWTYDFSRIGHKLN